MSQISSPAVILRGQTISFKADPFVVPPDEAVCHDSEGAVLLENGLIQKKGPAREVISQNPGVPVNDCGDALIMAGFVDTHMHYPQTDIIASYGEQLLEWLERYTFPQEQRFEDPSFAKHAAEFFLDQCLSNGTTTACVYGSVHPQSIDALFEASTSRRVRMAAGKACMDRNAPEGLMDNAQSAYDQSRALIEKWHGKARSTYAITPRFAPTSTPEQLEALGALWVENPTCLMQTHLGETRAEITWVKDLFPNSQDYLGVYEDFGLTGPGAIFGHAIYLTEREKQVMEASGSSIAHCPTSNAFIGSGKFNMHEATEAGLPVSLASDVGAGTSFSMFATLRSAYEAAHFNGIPLNPIQAFWLATCAGAKAMRMEDKIGNLEIGMEADLIVIDLDSTPLIENRMARADSLEDILFAQMILADDRAIKETWSGGLCVWQKDPIPMQAR